jgi:isopenicillin N synthase-like dioxygenase
MAKGAVEKLRARLPNLKESIEIGSEASSRYPEKPFRNQYPEEALPGFGEAVSKFYQQCDDLHQQLLSALAVGLGMDKDWLSKVSDIRIPPFFLCPCVIP